MSIWARVLLVSMVVFLSSCQSDSKPSVTIYCAHDRVHAEQILDLFEDETGIRVDAIFDTEANKTVGLAERLRAERGRPRCDVHWSNEPLRSVRLSREGLFRKMPSDLGAAIPEMWKDKSGLWCGFAGRVRVLAVQPTSPAGEMARIAVENITGIEVTTLEKATSMEPSATSSNTAMNTGM